MKIIARGLGFVKRLLKGEDVVLVPQSSAQWDEQYAQGTWDHITQSVPNTERIRNKQYTTQHAKVVISIVRFPWSLRSLFIWSRIATVLTDIQRHVVRSDLKSTVWDIDVATYNTKT